MTDGTSWPQDTDPNFQTVITFRPADNGVPAVIADTGIDDSPPPPPVVTVTTTAPTKTTKQKKAKPLISHIGRGRLVHRTMLELSFTLTARAHVRLIARRHGKVVAQTPRRTLKAGKRTLVLHLNPRRWPTALALNATPIGASGAGSAGGGGASAPPGTSAPPNPNPVVST